MTARDTGWIGGDSRGISMTGGDEDIGEWEQGGTG